MTFKIESTKVMGQRITGAFKDQSLEELINSLEFITNVTIVKDAANQFTIKASDEN